MNIQRLNFIFFIFFVFSTTVKADWQDKMSSDSQKLLKGLEAVVNAVNEKYPDFYNKKKELEITKKEFSKKPIKIPLAVFLVMLE